MAAAAALGMKFFLCGVADKLYLALEDDVLSGEGMVEVHDDILVIDFLDESHHAESVGSHHGYGVADLDNLVVKLAVDVEDFAIEGYDMFRVIWTESLFRCCGDLKSLAFAHSFKSLFQGLDYTLGNSENDLFGIFGICLVNEFLAVGLVIGVKVVDQFYVFSGFNFVAHNFFNVMLLCLFSFSVIRANNNGRRVKVQFSGIVEVAADDTAYGEEIEGRYNEYQQCADA